MQTIKDVYMYLLGALIIAGFFLLLYLLVYQSVPEINKDILNIVVGALIGMAGNVVNYFFGTSKSSNEKDKTISEQLKKP